MLHNKLIFKEQCVLCETCKNTVYLILNIKIIYTNGTIIIAQHNLFATYSYVLLFYPTISPKNKLGHKRQ